MISELIKAFVHRGETPPLYFWRDRTGHEVDAIIDTGKQLVPVEIKSATTISKSFFEGLRYFMSLGQKISPTGAMIHGGNDLYERENCMVLPWYQVT